MPARAAIAHQGQPVAAKGQYQCQHRNPRPAPGGINRQTGSPDQGEIAVKPRRSAGRPPHHKRCQRRAGQADGGQQWPVKPPQQHRQPRHQHQPGHRHFRPDQPVQLPRRDHGGKQRHDPGPGKHLWQKGRGGPRAITAATTQPLTRPNQQRAKCQRQRHPQGGRYQALFHAILHQEYPGQRQGRGRDRIDPVQLQPGTQRREPVNAKDDGPILPGAHGCIRGRICSPVNRRCRRSRSLWRQSARPGVAQRHHVGGCRLIRFGCGVRFGLGHPAKIRAGRDQRGNHCRCQTCLYQARRRFDPRQAAAKRRHPEQQDQRQQPVAQRQKDQQRSHKSPPMGRCAGHGPVVPLPYSPC